MATEAAIRVDLGALASGLRNEVARRVAAIIETTITALDERDIPLTEVQRCEFVDGAITGLDGLERMIAQDIAEAFRGKVDLWGLPEHLEDVLQAVSDGE